MELPRRLEDSSYGSTRVEGLAEQQSNSVQTSFRDGQTINGFYLVRLIGCGQLSESWFGTSAQRQQEAVVKTLSPTWANIAGAVAFFQQHLETLHHLHHPNVVAVQDCRLEEQKLYWITEIGRSGSIVSRIKRQGPLDAMDALGVVSQVADGLSHAARQGIVHGGLKPENIVTDGPGIARISDFGNEIVALRLVQAGHGSFRSLHPEFVSPEVRSGKPATAASDVFSLGAVLVYLISGVLPHAEVFHSAKLRITPAIKNLLLRMLAPRPDQRFSSYGELRGALDEAIISTRNQMRAEEESSVRLRAALVHPNSASDTHPELGSHWITGLQDKDRIPPMADTTSSRRRSEKLGLPEPSESSPGVEISVTVPPAVPAESQVAVARSFAPPQGSSLAAAKIPATESTAYAVFGLTGNVTATPEVVAPVSEVSAPVAMPPVRKGSNVLLIAAVAASVAFVAGGTVMWLNTNGAKTSKIESPLAQNGPNAGAPSAIIEHPETGMPIVAPQRAPRPVASAATPLSNEIVVDDGVPGNLILEPADSWRPSAELRSSHAAGSLVGKVDATPKKATFMVDVPADGKYEISLYWISRAATLRSTLVPVVVNTSSGAISLFVDQVNTPTGFNRLGKFELRAGMHQPLVTLSTENIDPAGGNVHISVDALKLVPVK